MKKILNRDAIDALSRGEKICFWCEDPFWKEQQMAVVLDRTVCDRNGSHIEKTWFHKDCAQMALSLIADAMLEEPVRVWSN